MIWFQTLLSNTIIFKHSIWPINGILTGTGTLDQSGPGSNGNEGLYFSDFPPSPILHEIIQSKLIKILDYFVIPYIGGGGASGAKRSS